MNTNDKFKKVEAMLYNYKNTIAEIKILKRDLEILENSTFAFSKEKRFFISELFSKFPHFSKALAPTSVTFGVWTVLKL